MAGPESTTTVEGASESKPDIVKTDLPESDGEGVPSAAAPEETPDTKPDIAQKDPPKVEVEKVPSTTTPEGTADPKPPVVNTDRPQRDLKEAPAPKKQGMITRFKNWKSRMGMELNQRLDAQKNEGHGNMYLQGYKMGYAITAMITGLLGLGFKGGAKLLNIGAKDPGLKATPGTTAGLNGTMKQGSTMFAGLRNAVKNPMKPQQNVTQQKTLGVEGPKNTASKITGPKTKAPAVAKMTK